MNRHPIGYWIAAVLISTAILPLASVLDAAAKKKSTKPTTTKQASADVKVVGHATPQQVQTAIEKAQKYLLAHRNKEGNWEEVQKPDITDKAAGSTNLTGRQWGGLTSIATYALLASGMDSRTPEMKGATDFLLHANITSIYGLGISSQIVLYLPPKDSSELVKRNVMMLLAGMNQPSAGALRSPNGWPPFYGFYGYWVGSTFMPREAKFPKILDPRKIGRPEPNGWYDRSNSQYGVLGMWALNEAGAEVPTLYWQIEDAAWKHAQLRDGGWNYNSTAGGGPNPTPSMTAAGIATLFITQDYTLNQDWKNCNGGVKNVAIERGLAWMDKHIDQALAGNTYTMYGIERIGTASGRKYFEKVDWYRQGADYLVKHQSKDGSWGGGHGPIPDTSFALVFLARGRAPVIMNKLEYTSAKTPANVTDIWNERPRDVANLAKWVGTEEESYLNWQVVNLQVTPEELQDAPILYISGSQPLAFTKEEQDKLRKYVQEGGMIVANSDCGGQIFNKSFIALGHDLFPKYEFHTTPLNDFFYTEQFKDFRVKPEIQELDNGTRKLLVLIPRADPSRAWQTRSSGTREGLFGLGANMFLYAVDKKNLMTKGETFLVTANPEIHPTKTLKVARLDVGDNPDPEPAGWWRMAALMHNTFKTDLKVDLVKPTALSSGYDVADLTGTGGIKLSPADRASIKQFVEKGGTLIVDAAGGDARFADSAEQELGTIFNDHKIELLPTNSVVYNYPGAKIEKVGWRSFAVDKVADKQNPKLRGITFGKRIGVFFSREDVSAGIVGEPVDGIYGYDPQTATDLMAGMLMYVQTAGVLPPAPAEKPEAHHGK